MHVEKVIGHRRDPVPPASTIPFMPDIVLVEIGAKKGNPTLKLLITGGAGFIGSHFAKSQLATKNRWNQVIILDALTYAGNRKNLSELENDSRFTFVHGNICDSSLIDSLTRDVDVIVNFAAESHVDRSLENGNAFAQTNVIGTTNLLQAALRNGVGLFHQVSTDEVYGSISKGSWDESFPLKPNSPYSSTKASADLIALSYFRSFGLDVRISRASNNYGSHQYPEKLIPLAITNMVRGLKVPIYGNGLNERDWLHVSDHCRGIEAILENGAPGEIYNIGGGNELTNLELVKLIVNGLGGSEDNFEFVQDRKGHDLRYSVDTSKIEQETGFKPRIEFEFGIIETIEWYKKNKHWWIPLVKEL